MKRLALLPFLLLAACARPHAKQYSVPTEFQPYIDSFVEASKQAGNPVEIDDLILEVVPDIAAGADNGLCTQGEGTPRIQISGKFWNGDLAPVAHTDGKYDYVEAAREILVWHELGHCILLRGHRMDLTQSVDKWGTPSPRSVMYPSVLGNSETAEYLPRHHEYVLELFGAGPGPN